MEFVSPIITPIVESLMVPVKKHLGFLVSCTKYAKKMDVKMKQLKATAQEVQAQRDRAGVNTEVIPQLVEPWLEEVQSLNERSTSIEAIGCFNVVKRYKVGKQSYGILVEIEDLENRQSKIVFTHAQKPLAELGSTSTSAPIIMGTHNNVKSRDSIFNDALEALKSDNESEKMIALCGMGGVGKTTMMLQLKEDVEASQMFDWVVKLVIGENPNTESLQLAIAQQAGNTFTESGKNERADRLHNMFKEKSQQSKNKKILVIMDDLWNDQIDLTDFGLGPLPHGFKLLFTSRWEHVCSKMGVSKHLIFKIPMLSETEARTLFFGKVGSFPSDGDVVELQRIGEDIVTKCGGLPMAIVTVAKNLRGNIKEAWEKALLCLKEDDLTPLEEIIDRIFKMSYENLKKDDDKEIFLLSGLFPDDFDIPIEDLLRYGRGLNFFKDARTISSARRDIEICVYNLKRANLLTESDRKGCVKMHDLVRAFVLSNFSKVKQASIHTLTKDASESYERILLKCTEDMCEIPRGLDYSNLSLLILMDGNYELKLPEDINKGMEKLKVMSFEKLGNIPLLPATFGHSAELRTLCLRKCSLMYNDTSFLGSLCNLEILSFVDCEIEWLPSTIGQLKKLKLFELTGCGKLCIDDGVFPKLDSLEELYMIDSRFTDGNSCDELEKLSHQLFALELNFSKNKIQPKNVSFKKLERFRISIGRTSLESINYDGRPFQNTLYLVADDVNELLECRISELFEKVYKFMLEVKNMNHLQEVSMDHRFSKLRDFQVSGCANLTYLFTVDVANGLKNLERLTISNCHVLTTLIGEDSGTDQVIRFQKLSFMSLKDLPEMVCLCKNVIELPEMVELVLDGLPNFTSISPDDNNNNTCERQSLLNKKVAIPMLEILAISGMENLKQVWPCEVSTTERNIVSKLRKIKVYKCDNLMNLFPSNPLPLLNHLEELSVISCGSIEVLFNIDFESVSGILEEYSRSKLRSIYVSDLKKLKVLWSVRGIINKCDNDLLINGGQEIQMRDCERFTSIVTPTTINFEVRSLNISYAIGDHDYNGKQEMNETYPSYLLHNYHHLQRLQLHREARILNGVLFEMDSPLFLYVLPTIQELWLHSLQEMSHVWKCNWNKLILHHQPFQYPFQNLTHIYLEKCNGIKYLFTPLMVKFLSKLKHVGIRGCSSIEQVISKKRDDEIEEEEDINTSSHQNITFFPCLDTLYLLNLDELKRIDGGVTIHGQFDQRTAQVSGTSWSLCQYPRQIRIYKCPALTSLVPWYAVGQMKRLEDLYIGHCSGMMEIFEIESHNYSTTSNNHVDEGSASSSGGGAGTTLTDPTLINITTLVLAVPLLSNLKSVRIDNCHSMQHIFTFSTLESLRQLKQLDVRCCKAMQVIVKLEENGTSPPKVVPVVFPRLKTLVLEDLPNLKEFFLGMNEFRWPSLDYVMIKDCPGLMRFTRGHSKTPKLKYIHTGLGKHSLECGLNFPGTINQTAPPNSSSDPTIISKGMPCSFHNLIEINIRDFNTIDGTAIIPSNALLQLEKLEKIDIRSSWSRVKEVFEVVALEGSSCGFKESHQTVVKIPNLTQMSLIRVFDLKYLWKSNQWMVLEFPNLTSVAIQECKKLEYVFTCSMVSSLVQLQDLSISNCENIEVIVKEDEEELCDGKLVNEIMLPRLKSLKLEALSSLKGFCLGNASFSLPSLEALKIKGCRAITVFNKGDLSTPELQVIDTSLGMYHVKTDLNSFIKTEQEEGRKL